MVRVALLTCCIFIGQTREVLPSKAMRQLRQGSWRAWLNSPGGQLPFLMSLNKTGDQWRAWIINGQERFEVPRVTISGNDITFDFEHYDSVITASASRNGRRLDGEWKKKTRGEGWTTLPFHASAGGRARFIPHTLADSEGAARMPSFDGRWAVKFSDSDDPAVAIFVQRPLGQVSGTILTTSGDFRYLDGIVESSVLKMSTFDGAHAFLIKAQLQSDGSLQGMFWSGDSHSQTWTATRDPEAKLPNPFEQTKWTGKARLSELKFKDLEGKMHSLADSAYDGKVRIIEIFGSWCPNCQDAAVLLNELYEEYADNGLSIVGLAFELTGNFERDARQVRRYVDRFEIKYPVLIAGVADKEKASAALPIIDRLRSFPTTIILDAEGEVHSVHTGFSGPATGEAHQKLREDFDTIIKELLAK